MLPFSNKEFKITIIIIFYCLVRRGQYEWYMENFIREKEILRKSNKNAEYFLKKIFDIDNSTDWLISRIETADRRINKLENDLIKLLITQTKHKVE